jgi:Na+/proline symporter
MINLDVSSEFSTIDYSVFGLMLILSALIGIYHIWIGRKTQTIENHLTGERKLKVD